jgi:capsule biosynthesis phosphatase
VKKLIVDLDHTITLGAPDGYANAVPNTPLIEQLRRYRKDGFTIVVNTSRSMRTYEGNVGRINAITLPVAIAWLERHNVPYDEIHVGKPWCGTEGFYVDDRAVRPSEFVSKSYEEIVQLLDAEREAQSCS